MINYNNTAIEAVNNGTDTPDAFYSGSKLIATSEWVGTDAWRGYTKIVPASGYKEVEASWLTGNWDDAPAGHSESEIQKQLEELEKKHGNVHVIFAPTSNVFSTSYAVIVRDNKQKIDNGKPYGHRTRIFIDPDGSYKVRYHATFVVEYNAKTSTYTLNSGGWLTRTTKDRINRKLPVGYYIQQRNFEWYLVTPHGTYDFKDHMQVNTSKEVVTYEK